MRRKSILKKTLKPEQKPKAATSLPHKNTSPNFNSAKPSVKPARRFSGDYGTRGTIGLEQTITIVQKTTLVQKTSLRQDAPFAESCLPKTMKIALDSRELLFPLLRSYPSSWSFIDKVFVMLAPVFQLDVEKHYANKGQSMVKMYHCLQIERFDKILARDLLEKIEDMKLKKEERVKSQRV